MYKKFDLFFGFFVITIFFWFLYVLTSPLFTSVSGNYSLRAVFSSADGISAGSTVKIAGVKVGEVISVTVNPAAYNAEIVIKVYDTFKLPVDSRASIQSSGLIGEKYIELSPGFEDQDLKDQDSIKYTQSSLNLEKLLSKFASGGASVGNK